MTTRLSAAAASGRPASIWPLAVSGNGRYLQGANGQAFLIHGDTPWSIAVQLTNTQIDTYFADRASKGFTAILFNAIEHYFSSQTPFYRNVSGNDPFVGMTHNNVDFTQPVEAYWQRVDYIVQKAKDNGIVCLMFPAYLGFGGGTNSATDQGWDSAVTNASAANLQSYGQWLANRYSSYGNVIWVMGGDYAGAASVSKQWNISIGIRNVNSGAIITGHAARTQEAYTAWSGFTGWNLNSIYTDGVEYTYAATAYGRAGPIPFFLIEGYYDGETATAADCRRQAYATLLSGACGHMYGNNPIWGFGEPHANGGAGAASALSTGLNTTAAQQMVHVRTLFDGYQWWKLEPRTDTSLISSSLGSGTGRVCPALASDGSFAMIWVPASQTVTLVKSALTPNPIRVRLYDPTNGTYTVHTASTSNTGTLNVATGGERIVVVDAA
jgi:hypothetical protein